MHIEILVALAKAYRDPKYLEIGVGDGGCFEAVSAWCSSAVAVDVPENPYTNGPVNVVASMNRRCHFYDCGANEFFRRWDVMSHDSPRGLFDLIFIDGSHWYEQVVEDLKNSLDHLAPQGTIAMHDTWAPDAEAARNGSDTAWQVASIAERAGYLQAFTLPIHPGLTLIRPNEPRSYEC